MRFGPHLSIGAALLAALAAVAPRAVCAYSPIEAEKGKQYKLTKKHGPWMIMVANFNEPPPEYKTEGMTPGQAADELVYELRKKGIPAYKYSRDDVVESLAASDRIGRQRARSYIAQQGSVCVLAGNYESLDDSVGQKTLKFVKDEKKFMPEFLNTRNAKASAESKEEKLAVVKLEGGGIFRGTPRRKSPLSGAFLTLNPLLSPEEVAKRKDDPLLLKLNGSSDYSLLRNPARYSVVVATFAGQSQMQVGNGKMDEAEKKFRADSLDNAAQNAFELCQALRQGKFNVETDPNKPPRYQPVKAWVFHDRYRSYVTVGEFDVNNANDPKVAQTIELFHAKKRIHPQTKAPYLAAEKLLIPSTDPKKLPDRMWIFDPEPIVMPVPKVMM